MSSLELASVAGPESSQQELESDNSMLEAQSQRGSDLELRDAFHPPSTTSQQAYGSTHMLEKGLPAEHRPLNFGIVVPGVYRSSFPQSEDYAFIEALNLKTMV
jgi:tyrosine-protein phosphatase SIW14